MAITPEAKVAMLSTVEALLRIAPKRVEDTYDYRQRVPQTRSEALDRTWREVPPHRADSLWPEVVPVYVPKNAWRVLLNGRDLRYDGGFDVPVHAGDEMAIFPPGR